MSICHPLCYSKTRAIEANPKIGDKEWGVSFIGNKQDPASSSSSNSESTDDTLISPLRKHAPSTQPRPPPSPNHLDRFKRAAPREILIDVQRFPLAFINGNPTPETPYSYFIVYEQLKRKQLMSKHLHGRSKTMRIFYLRPLRLCQQMP